MRIKKINAKSMIVDIYFRYNLNQLAGIFKREDVKLTFKEGESYENLEKKNILVYNYTPAVSKSLFHKTIEDSGLIPNYSIDNGLSLGINYR